MKIFWSWFDKYSVIVAWSWCAAGWVLLVARTYTVWPNSYVYSFMLGLAAATFGFTAWVRNLRKMFSQ